MALRGCVAATALVTALSGEKLSSVLVNADSPKAEAVMDPTLLRDKAMQVMETHCYSCHGAKKQKGDTATPSNTTATSTSSCSATASNKPERSPAF